MRARTAFALLFAGVLAVRLTNAGVVWVEEAYPAAAALQLLNGKALYRDVWFDKPPLSPYLYVLWGAVTGWPLRVAGALFITLCCWLIYRLGKTLWGDREGLAAAALLAFYLSFGVPSAVMALTPDLLMIAPHIAAIWLAATKRPAWSGAAVSVAFLLNPKAVFILPVCLLWNPGGVLWMLGGFLLPVALHLALADWQGALSSYWLQVWEWGFTYSAHSFVSHPVREGVIRTASWAGLHATIVAGALFAAPRLSRRLPFVGWLVFSLIAVAAGSRFFPRYYFQLLPVVTLLGARGLLVIPRKCAALLLLLLAIPLVRYGPNYIRLAQGDRSWRDLAMSEDSRRAAMELKAQAHSGDTLLVWGYRPDIYALTRMPAGTRFLDSQPLTGVLADRHLVQSDVLYAAIAAHNRAELITTEPDFIVDGLGPYNPSLAISSYGDLKDWLQSYQVAGRTTGCVIYRRTAPLHER
jgi:hypothetical protein